MILLAVALGGCGQSGPELAPVSGRVTLDGQPLAGGRLRFQPETAGGSPSYGSTDAEGRYELGYKRGVEGAMVGWHQVRIESEAFTDAEGKTKPAKHLPDRYGAKTELREEVKSGEDNVIDFELTSDEK